MVFRDARTRSRPSGSRRAPENAGGGTRDGEGGRPRAIATATTPASARSDRGALPWSANVHQRSLVGLHVTMGEHAGPRGRQQDDRNGRDPAGRERLAEKRRASVEVSPARKQEGQHGEEERRLLVVEPLEQRERGSRAQKQRGQEERSSSRSWSPRASRRSPRPVRLARKWEASISGRGTIPSSPTSRGASDGVAPERSRTPPLRNVVTVNRAGVAWETHPATRRGARETPGHFSVISCALNRAAAATRERRSRRCGTGPARR